MPNFADGFFHNDSVVALIPWSLPSNVRNYNLDYYYFLNGKISLSLSTNKKKIMYKGSMGGGGYISWFYRVSRPVMSHPVVVVEEPPHRPPNQKVIIEEEYARGRPDPF